MTVEVRLRIRHDGCMTRDLHPGTSVAQLSDEGIHSVFLASADSAAGLEGALEGLRHTLTGYRIATRSASTAIVMGACPPHGVESIIRSYNCSILWPALFADGHERYRVLAPSRDRIKHLLERLGELGSATVESLADADPETLDVSVRVGSLIGGLTTRQLDVLRSAVNAGYYATPRRTSTEALATTFGISRATLEEHLRKAEVKVLEAMVSTLAEHPAARAAPRKASRPRARA